MAKNDLEARKTIFQAENIPKVKGPFDQMNIFRESRPPSAIASMNGFVPTQHSNPRTSSGSH